ncbi:MAG: hypothetical protein OHK0046_13950 [Anaerolineae bacterium]
MQLRIDGENRTLTDIRAFRVEHEVPDEFSVALFEPKDYTGLGSVNSGGEAMNIIRVSVVSVIPPSIHVLELLPFVEQLQKYFRVRLYMANAEINLRDEEIDFAVSGFTDVVQKVADAIIYAGNTHTPIPDFDPLYQQWLDDTTRVSRRVHTYKHNGQMWNVNVLNNAYGRIGLIVETAEGMHYLYDPKLACPAEGFMYNLLKEVAVRISGAVTWERD